MDDAEAVEQSFHQGSNEMRVIIGEHTFRSTIFTDHILLKKTSSGCSGAVSNSASDHKFREDVG